MSAVVCGKRSFFEDSEPEVSPSQGHKRYRCSLSASPVRFGVSPPLQDTAVDMLKALFPDMKIEFLGKALEESGNNLDLAIKLLHDLSHKETSSLNEEGLNIKGSNSAEESGKQGQQIQKRLPVDGVGWVDLLLREMSCASSIDDARSRVTNVLESFESTITSHATAEVAQAFIKENEVLKGQIEVLLRDNGILKRGVAIQHERQKEHEEKNQEALQLKLMVAQCQEQLRNAEMKNYALALRLRHAEHSSIPGHFHPDVF